eukprot:CAMPEP_0195289710 /NCGR_PEP_ID=MMETSP0707-20130614/5871_1 /TAXON_ID=33640 /ORGANISM="Asterionellopsis glacialis, Strain CCMP134" /LENGTH=589 /DNA_ID=CAMNT_0040349741 /DNA_START=356 /DNA_END=2125 /DNA_ORIENTATION=-
MPADLHAPDTPAMNSNFSGGVADKTPRRANDQMDSLIQDTDVHVNLAMADLMGYLQVVADNSNNLPLTRRDDPELGRTVSTLTADEYAKKSAAFIPSTVRVIGGTFTKYGKVWDLPTGDEFDAVDGAQEPGRSYGGACCNALLKVLYDAESEAAEMAQQNMSPPDLFDDDEDSQTMSRALSTTRSRTTDLDLVLDSTSASNITWASLLRKMKAEMQEIEYPQAPKFTSSRKIDLDAPFSLVPENFDKTKNKKRSLLIGCNYAHIEGAELKASHDDIRSMKDYIVNVHGFPESKELMTVLLDDDDHKHPTHMNITEAVKSLSEQSQPGDAVFVQFSGHGGRILDSSVDSEAESYDEVIVPSDFKTCGMIRDTLIFKTLLAPMRSGVTLTILIDCCDTGMVMDLPYSWTTKNDRAENVAKMSLNDDFSFVRFLKVVKTLYESSIFTQLGNTVGSALTQPVAGHSRDESEYKEYDAGRDENATIVTDRDDETNVINADGAFCFGLTSPKKEKPPKKSTGGDTVDTRTLATSSGAGQSFFEQLVNCTMGHSADGSDDDYSYDGKSGDASTFDTGTDTEHESLHRRRRGRRRRN